MGTYEIVELQKTGVRARRVISEGWESRTAADAGAQGAREVAANPQRIVVREAR